MLPPLFSHYPVYDFLFQERLPVPVDEQAASRLTVRFCLNLLNFIEKQKI
jgi:hypothetical protein